MPLALFLVLFLLSLYSLLTPFILMPKKKKIKSSLLDLDCAASLTRSGQCFNFNSCESMACKSAVVEVTSLVVHAGTSSIPGIPIRPVESRISAVDELCALHVAGFVLNLIAVIDSASIASVPFSRLFTVQVIIHYPLFSRCRY